MKYDFAALRFTEDENISDRVYWYSCAFPVKEGEGVLAPVGARNRLQFARVERTLTADEAHAPYDVRLIKSVEAKFGARKLTIGRFVCFELGGVRYDEKHYTRFRRILFSEFAGEANDCERRRLKEYGVDNIVSAQSLAEIPSEGCVLLTGEWAKRLAEEIICVVREQKRTPLAEKLR